MACQDRILLSTGFPGLGAEIQRWLVKKNNESELIRHQSLCSVSNPLEETRLAALAGNESEERVNPIHSADGSFPAARVLRFQRGLE